MVLLRGRCNMQLAKVILEIAEVSHDLRNADSAGVVDYTGSVLVTVLETVRPREFDVG
jgi:hypothetical protein